MKRILKKIAIVAVAVMAAFSFSSCTTDYYEPVFYSKFPEIIPAIGGIYEIEYDYEYYATKANRSYFDFAFRVIINGEVIGEYNVLGREGNHVIVNIPGNYNVLPRTVIVEASTHVFMGAEDYWGDWTPVCSAVQLGN